MPDLDQGVPGVVSPWCAVASVKNDARLKDAELPDGVTHDMCVQAASEELFYASGRRWSGLRTDTIRWRRLEPSGGAFGGFVGWGWNDATGDVWNRRFPEGWACAASNELILPGPVTSVVEVTIDDRTLDPSEYALFDNRLLVRARDAVTGALLPWPVYQELGDAAGAVNTFSTTIQHGAAPPTSGVLAAREWSIQKVLFVSTQKTKLPQRTSRVDRQGTTITIEQGDMLKDGKVGIPLVDTFLTFANPKRLHRRARSFSVDDVVPARSSSSQP